MALVHDDIKNNIVAAFKAVMDQEEDREAAIDTVADKLAKAVEDAIKSATIMYTSGLVAPTGGGPVTGTFEGKLE